jgi:hypothetical protein
MTYERPFARPCEKPFTRPFLYSEYHQFNMEYLAVYQILMLSLCLVLFFVYTQLKHKIASFLSIFIPIQ